ncbi:MULTISPECIES: acyltransferase family protein [Citrobacter]|uniref:acyltransferase family protein n=1 Tax=Citrobacter TaxID=544 RepID=UPI0015E9FC41|nr:MULTISPECIES: acyltransferase [Citrobacter]EHG7581974.1 acyltransferase [Citrobacter sedlakii]EHG7584267.1 acyltransferase [Citrobacter sedlakii]EIQ7159114.1 acyltransferase [Citrobacter sedlakii]EIQ7160416.1 acyltransferase [Citrobacter sedlakii]MBN6600698.1 acyltransferase [Citrobacter sedlakii]
MRVQSIDYLRGLMSLSIVFYHFSTSFTSWGLNDSGAVLGRLGIYAVSAFYIISGMALYLAHRNDSWSISDYFVFIVRRFLRLAPVYWVGLILFTIFGYKYLNGFAIDIWKYAQNIFLIFGLTNPTEYILMGGWSIGNEVVFYIFFPVFIMMVKNRFGLITVVLASIFLLGYCSAFYLEPSSGIAEQWAAYINPINQIYFFVFGIVIAHLLLKYVGRNKFLFSAIAFMFSAVFIFYPAQGNQINIIVGTNKIVFTMITVAVCSMFFLIGDLLVIKPLHIALKFLGDISYPLYLMHGASFMFFRQYFYYSGITDATLIAHGLVMLVTLLVLSWLCHVGIEKPVIRLSKQYSKQIIKSEKDAKYNAS